MFECNEIDQELPESQRADAVSSMVYEANARIRDPVYGCAGAICQLQKQVNELQAQLAKVQAELVNMKCQQANILAFVSMEMAHSPTSNASSQSQSPEHPNSSSNNACFIDDNNLGGSLWEPLWTWVQLSFQLLHGGSGGTNGCESRVNLEYYYKMSRTLICTCVKSNSVTFLSYMLHNLILIGFYLKLESRFS